MRRNDLLRAVPAALVAGLLLAGCSQGSDAFNENFPGDDPQTQPREIVRTPVVVDEGLPYETPPVIVPLPGPTGGVPGQPPTAFPPASPGEGDGATTTEQ